ncbi:MAG: RIP metalloprotease RseP [Bdellovibrionales bacterium]|nr:RIP metalloprotease RseP [Bdellovibrionales bacterium]
MKTMELLTNALHGIASGIGPFFILLGILIFVHELGHFLVAKFFGVRVEVFSLGFGKKILQFQRGDTLYCISIIPLGGYVKMFGDDPTKEISEQEKKYSFLHQPVLPRIAIVLAGPLMNLLFAFLLFIFIGLNGEPLPGPYLGDITPKTKAYEAGFRSGDKILSINEEPVQTWIQVKEKIALSVNEPLVFNVEREDSLEKGQIKIAPTLGANDNILSSKKEVGVIEGLDPSSMGAMIGVIDEKSVAAQAGLKNLDVILSINDREVNSWRDMERYIKEDVFKNRLPLQLKVQSYAGNDPGQPRQLTMEVPRKELDVANSHGVSGATVPQGIELSDLGLESAQFYLWKIKRNSPADQANLKPGDRLQSINGEKITDWMQVIELVKKYQSDSNPLEFVLIRSGTPLTVSMRPELSEVMDPTRGKTEKRFTVGIVSGLFQTGPKSVLVKAKGLGEVFSMGIHRTIETTKMVVISLVRLVQGDVSAKNIGGIISIGRFANQSYEAGIAAFLKMMALISVNLFLLNLLPVPVLDGGHLLFFTIEALRGAPMSMKKMEIAQQVGLVLLMSLMAFALFNDISNWLNSFW